MEASRPCGEADAPLNRIIDAATPRTRMIPSRITLGLLASLTAAPAFAALPNCPYQFWSPPSLKYKEKLPNTHAPGDNTCRNTELSITDWYWMDRVELPDRFRNLRIKNMSVYPSSVVEIQGPIYNVPGGPLKLPSGESIEFHANATGSEGAWLEWQSSLELSVPNQQRWQIPTSKHLVSFVVLRDGQHARELLLPNQGTAYQTIVIDNLATTPTEVLGGGTDFLDQRITVHRKQLARAEYDPARKVWTWVHEPYYHNNDPRTWEHRVSSRTIVEFSDGKWAGLITLPRTRSDRDRMIYRSSASIDSVIRLDYGAPEVILRKGDELEFVFLAELGHWQLVRRSGKEVKFHELRNGKLEEKTSFVRVVVGSPNTSYRTLTLPKPETERRVLVENTALWQIDVAHGTLRETVRPREQVAFRVNDKGVWERETTTIDLLFIVDQQVEAVGGMGGALKLMEENLKLTNEALENSGATFRYRQAYTLADDFTFPGVESFDIAYRLAHDPDVTAIRKLIRADGVYYGGTLNTNKRLPCGNAYAAPSQGIYSIATSLLCPTTTLRQQVAYGLGMPKAQPRQPVPVIGYGNELPYYPTPNRVLPDGYRMFNPGQEGYVDRMNERAELVAGFSDLL